MFPTSGTSLFNPSLFWLHLQVTKSEVCIRLPVFRDHNVAHVQDAVVQVYDYYEPSEYSLSLFTLL